MLILWLHVDLVNFDVLNGQILVVCYMVLTSLFMKILMGIHSTVIACHVVSGVCETCHANR